MGRSPTTLRFKKSSNSQPRRTSDERPASKVISMIDDTIYFCIPLIGRLAAKNWDHVGELFDQTLQSVLTQEGNLKVLVAGNDIPVSRFIHDPRLEFLHLSREMFLKHGGRGYRTRQSSFGGSSKKFAIAAAGTSLRWMPTISSAIS